MIADWSKAVRRALAAAVCAVAAVGAPALAHADDVAPGPGWAPDYTTFPYNLWQNRVTPEMVTAEGEACHWFNTQYDGLSAQIFGFQNALRDTYDVWPNVQADGDAVRANVDRAAGFLDPRVHILYITNYPDQSQYSPLYNGDSFYHLWYQLTSISDKLARRMPSGVINANTATMRVYGDTIRNSGVCNGA
ncbi:MAG: hypothetical protein U0R66_12895 [Mycobacterium sp.]